MYCLNLRDLLSEDNIGHIPPSSSQGVDRTYILGLSSRLSSVLGSNMTSNIPPRYDTQRQDMFVIENLIICFTPNHMLLYKSPYD